MTVIIKKIPPPTCLVYNPDNTLLGEVNEYEFNDIRIQIREQGLSGYYAKFGEDILKIDSKGRGDNWLLGMFDLFETQLNQLL